LREKRIIHGLPFSESEEDLLEALLLQGATKVERFPRTTDGSKEPTGIVCITFDRPLTARVTIISLSFAVSTTPAHTNAENYAGTPTSIMLSRS
jgi:hypothetical protein